MLIKDKYNPIFLKDFIINKKTAEKYSKFYNKFNVTNTVVYGGKAYVNWLPYKEHTLKRAKLFFDSGEPFQQLSPLQKNKISEYHIIRNAIAHKSPNSLNHFNNIIAQLALLPREKTPTGYLRSKPQGSGQTCNS